MAAWTLPQRIADWINLLSSGLDRRSRKYLPAENVGDTPLLWARR
jgi:hypothetical protein